MFAAGQQMAHMLPKLKYRIDVFPVDAYDQVVWFEAADPACGRIRINRADAHIRFYSDHASDAPVLEWSDEPFAVNAHRKLRRLARRRGWPLLDWR